MGMGAVLEEEEQSTTKFIVVVVTAVDPVEEDPTLLVVVVKMLRRGRTAVEHQVKYQGTDDLQHLHQRTTRIRIIARVIMQIDRGEWMKRRMC